MPQDIQSSQAIAIAEKQPVSVVNESPDASLPSSPNKGIASMRFQSRIRVLGDTDAVHRFHSEVCKAELMDASEKFSITLLARDKKNESLAVQYDAERVGKFPTVQDFAMNCSDIDVLLQISDRLDQGPLREYVARRSVTLLCKPDRPLSEPVPSCTTYFLEWAQAYDLQLNLPQDMEPAATA